MGFLVSASRGDGLAFWVNRELRLECRVAGLFESGSPDPGQTTDVGLQASLQFLVVLLASRKQFEIASHGGFQGHGVQRIVLRQGRHLRFVLRFCQRGRLGGDRRYLPVLVLVISGDACRICLVDESDDHHATQKRKGTEQSHQQPCWTTFGRCRV